MALRKSGSHCVIAIGVRNRYVERSAGVCGGTNGNGLPVVWYGLSIPPGGLLIVSFSENGWFVEI
jgi:hypothetical protein